MIIYKFDTFLYIHFFSKTHKSQHWDNDQQFKIFGEFLQLTCVRISSWRAMCCRVESRHDG